MKVWVIGGILGGMGVLLGWGGAVIPQVQRACQAQLILDLESRHLSEIRQLAQRDPLLAALVERSFLVVEEARNQQQRAILGPRPDSCGFVKTSTAWAWRLLDSEGRKHYVELFGQTESARLSRTAQFKNQEELWRGLLPKYHHDQRTICRLWLNVSRLEKLTHQARSGEAARGPCSKACPSGTSQSLRKLYNSEKKRFDDISGEFKEKWGESLLNLQGCGLAE